MKVSRSTFVQRDCVLTALTVAVLLAGFSVTAWAQTPTNFTLTMGTSSGTLEEGASSSNSTPDRVTVTITRTNPTYSADHDDDNTTPTVSRPVFNNTNKPTLKLSATCNGVATVSDDDCDISIQVKGGSELSSLGTGATFDFAATDGPTGNGADIEKTIELLVTDDADDDDWNEETVVLTLELNANFAGADGKTYTATSKKRTLTITDDEPMPVLKFGPKAVQLAKNNEQKVKVEIGVGAGGSGALPTGMRQTLYGLSGATKNVLLSVDPADAVGRLIRITKGTGDSAGPLPSDGRGGLIVGKIGGSGAVVGGESDANSDGIELTIKALDVSSFRDETISLTLTDGRREAEKDGDGGGITDSDPATVTILSGEETPTVTFSKESVSLKEGGMETVHVLADTDQGDQVGSVAVRVRGEATISLEQGGSPISNGVVEFGDSANAELTIRALPDLTLEDGEEKTATVTITDASGANIGDPRSLSVTVVGSTAVPVLPLVGQLLLALLLTAGGARLYRRRQQ